MEKTRINKYLSEVGFCSRREADRMLEQGRITINGAVPEMGTKVSDEDEIFVDGVTIKKTEEAPVYIALNKPVGIVCTTDTKRERDNIIEFVNHPKRIFPIGRLDKPSEGLILLTNDGDIVNKILRSRNNHGKEYIVRVDRPITPKFLMQMRGGIPILDTITNKCEVEQIDNLSFRIVLTQGLNRQIRRMCEFCDYEVKKLKRIRVLNIKLDLPIGKWRDLTEEEVNELKALVSDSDKAIN